MRDIVVRLPLELRVVNLSVSVVFLKGHIQAYKRREGVQDGCFSDGESLVST